MGLPEGKPHVTCPLCEKHGLPSTCFCGVNCPADPWDEHREWHRECDDSTMSELAALYVYLEPSSC